MSLKVNRPVSAKTNKTFKNQFQKQTLTKALYTNIDSVRPQKQKNCRSQ